MAEIGTMSEQKRLGVAWGTTFAMVFTAVVAANTVDSRQQPEAEGVLEAHQSFQESVAMPWAKEKNTSFKPQVEPADEKPELVEVVDAVVQESIESETPISTPDENVEMEASVPVTITPVEPEVADDSTAVVETFEEDLAPETVVAVAPEETAQPDSEVPGTETIDSELTEDVALVREVELVNDVEVGVQESLDSSPAEVDAFEIDEAEGVGGLAAVADAGQPASATENPTSDALVDDVPDVEPAPLGEDPEGAAVVSNVAPPVPAFTTSEADLATAEAKSVEHDATVSSSATPAVLTRSRSNPFLGVGIRNANDSVVTTIYAGSTAESLGIKLGDRLVSVNGQPVSSVETLRSVLKGFDVDAPTSVEIERDGKTQQLGPKLLGTR